MPIRPYVIANVSMQNEINAYVGIRGSDCSFCSVECVIRSPLQFGTSALNMHQTQCGDRTFINKSAAWSVTKKRDFGLHDDEKAVLYVDHLSSRSGAR